MSWLSPSPNGVIISLRIVPRASRNEICGELDSALKIRLQAPPVEGKANKALRKFIAKKLNISQNRITILSGETGRMKRVEITGITGQLATAGLLQHQ